MKILLSNDDGIWAKGLKVLYELLYELGHEVYIFAPEQQASGVSHALTLAHPLIPKKVLRNGKFYGVAVNGSPSDAVKLGLSHSTGYDLIMSGINLGNNAGPAIYYSGTVAAAFEGMVAGKPALAFSFDSFEEKDFEGLQDKLRPFMATFFELAKKVILYNINIPNTPNIKGIQVARQFRGFYIDQYEKRLDPKGREYYWLNNDVNFSPEKNGASLSYPHDMELLEQGYIAVTPLQFDLTDYAELKVLEQQLGKPEITSSHKEARAKPYKARQLRLHRGKKKEELDEEMLQEE
jgi:5'-nucleotidase